MIYIRYKILEYLIFVLLATDSRSNHCCECIICICKYFITMFHVTRFFCLFILGHKLHRFVDSFHYCREQRGKCNRHIWLIKIFLQCDWFHIFYALTFILQDTLTVYTWSSPRHPLFLHTLSFDCTSKLCINFINQFSVYFHI